jgi:hypothetical protein
MIVEKNKKLKDLFKYKTDQCVKAKEISRKAKMNPVSVDVPMDVYANRRNDETLGDNMTKDTERQINILEPHLRKAGYSAKVIKGIKHRHSKATKK